MEFVDLLFSDPDPDPEKRFVIDKEKLKIIQDTITYIQIFHSHEIKKDELPRHHDFIKRRLESLRLAYGQGITICS